MSWWEGPQERARFWSASQASRFGLNQLFLTAWHSCLYKCHLVWDSSWSPYCHNGTPEFYNRRHFVLCVEPLSLVWLQNIAFPPRNKYTCIYISKYTKLYAKIFAIYCIYFNLKNIYTYIDTSRYLNSVVDFLFRLVLSGFYYWLIQLRSISLGILFYYSKSLEFNLWNLAD